jgi:hypothetical protein
MDKAQIAEWQAVKKEHDDAHHRYLYVHTALIDRIADAARGMKHPTTMDTMLEAHEQATERWHDAKLKLHAFCRKHRDVC